MFCMRCKVLFWVALGAFELYGAVDLPTPSERSSVTLLARSTSMPLVLDSVDSVESVVGKIFDEYDEVFDLKGGATAVYSPEELARWVRILLHLVPDFCVQLDESSDLVCNKTFDPSVDIDHVRDLLVMFEDVNEDDEQIAREVLELEAPLNQSMVWLDERGEPEKFVRYAYLNTVGYRELIGDEIEKVGAIIRTLYNTNSAEGASQDALLEAYLRHLYMYSILQLLRTTVSHRGELLEWHAQNMPRTPMVLDVMFDEFARLVDAMDKGARNDLLRTIVAFDRRDVSSDLKDLLQELQMIVMGPVIQHEPS